MSFEHPFLTNYFSLGRGDRTSHHSRSYPGEDDESDEDDNEDGDEEDYSEPTVPRQEEIRIVVVQPGQPAQVVTVRNELSEMQRIVGGLIEVFPVGIPGAVGVCNEEGLLLGLPWCRFVPAAGAAIAGTFFVAADGSSFASLSPRQIAEALALFG
jgi:hypothetical protein